MYINNFFVKSDGYVDCKSDFYSAKDTLSNNSEYTFFCGINMLIGEIDSGNWAISYLLSMFNHRPQDFILFEEPRVILNDEPFSYNELSGFTCYMDRLFPLFSTEVSVRECVEQGLRRSRMSCSVDEVKTLFYLDDQRFERPLSGNGNEIFRAMAAIGYSCGKEVFCFPWMSNRRFEYYNRNLSGALEILEGLNKTIIMPVGIKA